jgi:putative transposase
MSDQQWQSEREVAIHLLRSGLSVKEVSEKVGHTQTWVYKWKQRYEREGWDGLSSQSRARHQNAQAYDEDMHHMILQVRSELEAEAASDQGLCYVGATTLRARLMQRIGHLDRVPSTATIERVLCQAGMTRPQQVKTDIPYPHLNPTLPHQVQQLDIVPHYLPGGQLVACFNGLDIVSRYPVGQTMASKSSGDAARFLLRMWTELGISSYTQMDNESCFCGGHTHPHVIGKVVRLCLLVGTQPVFIPIRHPKSNGSVERFHQDYDQHVWKRHDLDNLAAVNTRAEAFFKTYRATHYPAALSGRTPQQVHETYPTRQLPAGFAPDLDQLPVTAGQIHFIRKVEADGAIPLLNTRWDVPDATPQHGVWATLTLSTAKADGMLCIFDQAPDAISRTCLISHPFPLALPVVALRPEFHPSSCLPVFNDVTMDVPMLSSTLFSTML